MARLVADDVSMIPFAPTPSGTRITLQIQPRASQTEIAGLHGNALRIRIAAPPVDGAANETLLRFLADRLDVPRSALALTGYTGRKKTVTVNGMSPAEVESRLRFTAHRPR